MSLVNLCTTSQLAYTPGIASVAGGNLCLNVRTIRGDSGLVLGGVLQNLHAGHAPQWVELPEQAYQPELTNLLDLKKIGSSVLHAAPTVIKVVRAIA